MTGGGSGGGWPRAALSRRFQEPIDPNLVTVPPVEIPEPRRFPRFGARPTFTEALARFPSWRNTHTRLRVLFFLTLGLLIWLGVKANDPADPGPAETWLWEQSGLLSESDSAFDDGSGVYEAWVITLVEAEPIHVELHSGEIKPDFFVVGPIEDEENATVVAESRLSADGGSALADITPLRSGEYVLFVPGYAGSPLGAYRLVTTQPLYTESGEGDPHLLGDATGSTGSADTWGPILAGLLMLQLIGLPAFLLWRSPDRILLLRPFGEAHISRALKRFNRATLAYRGFTFTLADKHLKDSFGAYVLAHVPLDFGSLATVLYRPLFRRIHRYQLVRKPGDLAILQLRLRSRWRLTAFWQSWLGLTDRINKFRSSDQHWQDCIRIMLENCQVIVVDVTRAGEGTSWEIEEVYRRGLAYKTIFMVVDEENETRSAIELLTRIAPDRVPFLHHYSGSDGSLVNPAVFDQAYAEAVSSPEQPVPAPLPLNPRAALSPIPVLGLVLGVLGLQDIRRARGMMGGELVAHVGILFNLVTLAAIAVVFIVFRLMQQG